MAKIPLKKPVEHDGKTWKEVDFDPSLGALEAFEEALASGVTEMKAMIALIVHDGDTPIEVARQLRQSDMEAAQAGLKPADPLPSSTSSSPPPAGGDGEAPQPILHTS
ncbi:phage tail assembly protein [Phenylobacterium sp.]|uniref:phage tail assembly protein n=1 Tax=Phenylobacterium sp. TaxID=1871053 RepID=UPI00272F6E81|nr:phage tail assembly protein [Phenylobacterium sp.]MDP2214780.1 phage tail assembly protein [Phenylobacterium sp.]